MEDILVPPLIVFLIFIAPLWLILHYRSKRQINQGLSDEEYSQLEELSELADKMADRINTLETILDSENPKWRTSGERSHE